MSLLGAVQEILDASSSSTNRGGRTEESQGAYWCHDCGERVLDLDTDGDRLPECPACGDEMEFERSVGAAGCAC